MFINDVHRKLKSMFSLTYFSLVLNYLTVNPSFLKIYSGCFFNLIYFQKLVNMKIAIFSFVVRMCVSLLSFSVDKGSVCVYHCYGRVPFSCHQYFS